MIILFGLDHNTKNSFNFNKTDPSIGFHEFIFKFDITVSFIFSGKLTIIQINT